jgi:ribonuclease HI
MSNINIYTDGSSLGNPGPGGYGIVLEFNGKTKEISKGFRLTTNNRMELLAVVDALKSLKTNKYDITIFSDSKYVIDSIQKGWLNSWKNKGFKGKKNKDLWLEFLYIQKEFKIEYKWVKGHNGHPQNERCDELAVAAASSNSMAIDVVFEEERNKIDGE